MHSLYGMEVGSVCFLSVKLLKGFRSDLVLCACLHHKLLGRFNFVCFYFIIMPTLHNVQVITLSLFSKMVHCAKYHNLLHFWMQEVFLFQLVLSVSLSWYVMEFSYHPFFVNVLKPEIIFLHFILY